MNCQVCGNFSGKYVLCKNCYRKKEQGLIIKCNICNKWHYADQSCINSREYLYELKSSLLTKTETLYYKALIRAIPDGYNVFPQSNLATFIERTDNSKFCNELFRNVDFLITDNVYKPLIIIEINDQTHFNSERKKRDEKIKNICEEAGIPILTLWTSYGVNEGYIKRRISEGLASLPIERKHNFLHIDKVIESQESINNDYTHNNSQTYYSKKKKQGCYIATCVYGSYDSPEVCTLRRYRDYSLSKTWIGRLFIKVYYAVSPILVKCFGNTKIFKKTWKKALDKLVLKLQCKGYESKDYEDC